MQAEHNPPSTRRFLMQAWHLATPYWRSQERWRAWGLLAAIVTLTLCTVYLLVELNEWSRQFFNAVEQKSSEDFFVLLTYFCFLAALFIVASIYRNYLQQALEMHWRIWLSQQYLGRWMDQQVYYRLELDALGTDNPDQRIAEDLRLFTSGSLASPSACCARPPPSPPSLAFCGWYRVHWTSPWAITVTAFPDTCCGGHCFTH